MIAIGKPFIEILMDAQLSLEEYFVLYCFSYDKRDLVKLYSNNVEAIKISTLHSLKDKGYLYDTPIWVITEKGNSFIRDLVDSYHDAKSDNPFLGDEDLVELAENIYETEFNTFLSTYPSCSRVHIVACMRFTTRLPSCISIGANLLSFLYLP